MLARAAVGKAKKRRTKFKQQSNLDGESMTAGQNSRL